jgi:hypothetical protein
VLNRVYEAIESLRNSFLLDPEKKKEFELEFPEVKSLREFRNLLRR